MANTSELEKGLNELKRLTGITLAVTAEDSEQEQMALEQIEKRTGLDLRQFEDAMTFKIATMVMNYLHAEKEKNCTEM